MIRKIGFFLTVFFLSIFVLVPSFFASQGGVHYVFGQSPPTLTQEKEMVEINYPMPYPGRILPDSPFWPVKALRDRLWLVLAFKPEKKTEILLLLANKRVASAKTLFEREKPELALVTLEKSQAYLKEALDRETKEEPELTSLGLSVLKHRQLMEEMLYLSPEDAKPYIVRLIDNTKTNFNKVDQSLNDIGASPVKNPFEN